MCNCHHRYELHELCTWSDHDLCCFAEKDCPCTDFEDCRHDRTRLTERDSIYCTDCRSDIAVIDN